MKERICKHCDRGNPVLVRGGSSIGRCLECKREKDRKAMAASRLAKKKELLANDDQSDGRKVCSKCLRRKLLSEFSPGHGRKDGTRLRKLCDSCLTVVYSAPSRASQGFDEIWWRKRAYTCNTAGRQAVARVEGVKVSAIKTEDLPYICKPQDLVKIFEEQSGKCHYCQVDLQPDGTSVDHADPLSRGGKHHPDNFRVCCSDCNHLKWKRNEEEFFDFMKSYACRWLTRQ